MPTEIFFGTLAEPLTRKDAAMARMICAGCPVRRQCSAAALRNDEPHGIWAGMSIKQRRRLLALANGDWKAALALAEPTRQDIAS